MKFSFQHSHSKKWARSFAPAFLFAQWLGELATLPALPAGTLSKADVAAIDKYSALGGDTINRRTSSVISWLPWLETTLGELRVGEQVLRLD